MFLNGVLNGPGQHSLTNRDQNGFESDVFPIDVRKGPEPNTFEEGQGFQFDFE